MIYVVILNTINNIYFSSMMIYVFPKELNSNKANFFHHDDSFLYVNLTILDGIIKTKTYEKKSF